MWLKSHAGVLLNLALILGQHGESVEGRAAPVTETELGTSHTARKDSPVLVRSTRDIFDDIIDYFYDDSDESDDCESVAGAWGTLISGITSPSNPLASQAASLVTALLSSLGLAASPPAAAPPAIQPLPPARPSGPYYPSARPGMQYSPAMPPSAPPADPYFPQASPAALPAASPVAPRPAAPPAAPPVAPPALLPSAPPAAQDNSVAASNADSPGQTDTKVNPEADQNFQFFPGAAAPSPSVDPTPVDPVTEPTEAPTTTVLPLSNDPNAETPAITEASPDLPDPPV